MSAKLGDNAIKSDAFTGVLPKPMAERIMTKAYSESIMGKLSGSIPMPITGAAIAWATGDPVAGIVGQGEVKPVVKTGVATKTTTPIKAAAVMYWSKEARQANPLGFLNILESQAADAVRKAIDMAMIHGKNALTNSPISGVEYLTQTKHKVELGTAGVEKGGLAGDILAGYDLVTASEGDISAFAADPRMRVKLMTAIDKNGRPIYTFGERGGVNLRDQIGDLMGLPVSYSRAVSGKVGTVTDTKTRMIGGDFENDIKFGYVENITVRKSDQATIVDGENEVHLFQQNMEAFIVEAQFGWIIRDVNRFVVYAEKGDGLGV